MKINTVNNTLLNRQWWSKNWLRLLGIGAGSGALAAFAIIFALSFYTPAGLALPAAFFAFHAILASSPVFLMAFGAGITAISGLLAAAVLVFGIANLPSAAPAAARVNNDWGSRAAKGAQYGSTGTTSLPAAIPSSKPTMTPLGHGSAEVTVNPMQAAAAIRGDATLPDTHPAGGASGVGVKAAASAQMGSGHGGAETTAAALRERAVSPSKGGLLSPPARRSEAVGRDDAPPAEEGHEDDDASAERAGPGGPG